MLQRTAALLRGLSRTRASALGVPLAAASLLAWLFLLLLQVAGVMGNSYAGLITLMALPGLFFLGLLLVAVGWVQLRRRTGKTLAELAQERFPGDMVRGGGLASGLAVAMTGLTVVLVLGLGAGGAAFMHHMDSAAFCGTTCHTVMNPEWVTYQSSPHAHVACVECHVGEGLEALVSAKLNGLRQVWLVTTGGYNRPIPTPVHTLRPARETCETCHWPDQFYGDRIKNITRYATDAASTPRHTTLALKVGGGGEAGKIHWHVGAENTVRYRATDGTRMTMAWVEVQRGDRVQRYVNRRLRTVAGDAHGETRTLDCIDCHNRATHIYRTPEDVVDGLLAAGTIDRTLPWAKAAALAALTTPVAADGDPEAAMAAHLESYYRYRAPEALTGREAAVTAAAAALAAAHRRNIHPAMKVEWGTYPSHLGHRQGKAGCFRCHNDDLVDDQGRTISNDCTLCHSLLAFDSPSPFHYLKPGQADGPEAAMAGYLRREFTGGD